MTAPKPSWTTPAVVTRVIDGDTLDVEVRRTLRIRLLDCWAPESRTKDIEEKRRGMEAKAALLKLLAADSHVTVRIPTDGQLAMADVLSMGRFLGDVWLSDGRRVADVLREQGHAFATKEELQEAGQ